MSCHSCARSTDSESGCRSTDTCQCACHRTAPNTKDRTFQTRLVRGHRQIIHFTTGHKRTILGVTEVWENEWTHIVDKTGKEWIINKANVLCVEVIP